MSRSPNLSKFTAITADATNLPIQSSSVRLIIAHPPYLGVDTLRYGGNPQAQINHNGKKHMLKLLVKALKEMKRVIKNDGNIFIATNDSDEMSERLVIAAVDKVGLKHLGKVFQHSYEFEPAFHSEERIVENSVTVWHHFAKGSIYYNPFMVKKYNDPVWAVPFDNQDGVIDSINREIPNRLIQMFSKPGEMILDPFGGSGVVAVTAVELGRVAMSVDISETQTEAANKRAKQVLG